MDELHPFDHLQEHVQSLVEHPHVQQDGNAFALLQRFAQDLRKLPRIAFPEPVEPPPPPRGPDWFDPRPEGHLPENQPPTPQLDPNATYEDINDLHPDRTA